MYPIVSILVTVFNREAYIEETLKSVLESKYTDIEVIVVDDASSDKSLSIAKRIEEADDRVRVYCNDVNLGDYGNRAKAASLATGKYLKYIDSDDILYPHSLAIMVESMEKYPDASVALSHSMPEDESPYPWCLSPLEAYRKQFLGRGCLNCGPSSAIIRRDIFESVGGFNKSWGVLSDTELWLRMAARWPVVLLPPGLVWWRRHEGQEFTKNDAGSVYLQSGYELNVKALTDSACPLSATEQYKSIARVRQHFARRLLSLALRNKKVGLAHHIFRQSSLTMVDLAKGLFPYI